MSIRAKILDQHHRLRPLCCQALKPSRGQGQGASSYVETLNDVDIERSANADYWNYGASISKTAGDFGTFSLNWDQNNGEENVGFNNDPKFWVGWLKTF